MRSSRRGHFARSPASAQGRGRAAKSVPNAVGLPAAEGSGRHPAYRTKRTGRGETTKAWLLESVSPPTSTECAPRRVTRCVGRYRTGRALSEIHETSRPSRADPPRTRRVFRFAAPIVATVFPERGRVPPSCRSSAGVDLPSPAEPALRKRSQVGIIRFGETKTEQNE